MISLNKSQIIKRFLIENDQNNLKFFLIFQKFVMKTLISYNQLYKNPESSASFTKIMSQTQKAQTNQIRLNRSRMRQNIKLNHIEHKKKNHQSQITHVNQSGKLKTQTRLQLIKRVGLGHFEDVYDLKEKIGEGAHATVYRCTEKSTGKDFAVKITKQGDQELIEGARVPFKILKNLDHENIMKVEAYYTDRVKLTTYLVSQLCPHPDLGVYFRNRKNKYLPQAQATTIISSILKTLQYLHQKGVCHRDIKPENILYDPENKKIKIIDFDCALMKKEPDSKFEMWTKTGSFHYQAPQCFSSTVYDQKIDLWATGVIAYEMISGKLPFNSLYYNRMIKLITQNEVQINSLNASDYFKVMLKKLLEKDPAKRYTAKQCLQLPVLLKQEQVHVMECHDDFDLKLKGGMNAFPTSQTKIHVRTFSTITCGKSQPLPLLKYFCFVADL